MSEPWTVRRILQWTHQHFERRGIDAPRLTAEILLAFALNADRIRLYVDLDRPLDVPERDRFRALVERRLAGEPTQYLTGKKDFYNRPFLVDPRVLIPRPETELLVEAALQALPEAEAATALDLCTGSGCIAVSLAAERPQLEVWATDLSADACTVARVNAETLGVSARCHIVTGDLDAPIAAGQVFDVVVSNPPYVAEAEIPTLSAEVQREPRLALDGGRDGLELVRRVIGRGMERLRPGGLLGIEVGETHGPAVRDLLLGAGYVNVRIERDWERRERLAFGVRPP